MLITAAIAAAGGYAVSNLRETVLADTERELQNVASFMTEHLERTFEALTLTQLGFVMDLQPLDIRSVNEFESRMADEPTHHNLQQRIVNLLPVHELVVVSAHGHVINSSRHWPANNDSIADTEDFKALKESIGLSSYVGAPTQDSRTGEWRFHVSYKVTGRDGEFLGVLVGVMRLSYFEQLFSSIDLGRGSSLNLVRRDGLLLTRYPRVEMSSVPSFSMNPLFSTVLPRHGKGVMRLKGLIDGQQKLVAGRNLVRHPLAVSAALDVDVALANWRKGAVEIAAMAFLMALVFGGMIVLCARQVAVSLNRQAFKLDSALNNMSHGLCMFDARGRLTLYNTRYREILNIPAGLIEPGMTLMEVLRRLEKAEILTGAQDQYVADLMASIASRRVFQTYRELKDGRTISVTNRPLPNGGWVGIHEDVTELKQREKELSLENVKLDAALQNMSQGLVMFDKDGRLIVCNQKYAEIYGIPSDLIKPGIYHKQILEHRIASGIIAPSSATQYLNDRLEKAKVHSASDAIVELSDGRTILLAQRPLVSGGWVTTHEDITARRQAEAQIAHMAHHDPLTDLPNRARLRERLEEALHHVRRSDQLAVLYLDLDHFKSVNDTLGHSIGDALLKTVARRLLGCVRDTDTVARLGGDEFAVIQTALQQPADAAKLATRIREELQQPYNLEDHQVPADVSIGISIAPSDSLDPDQLLKNADMALYRAKADGRGTFRFFEPEMDECVKARRTLELDLRKAIVNSEFELYYQPLVNLEQKAISCCETLLRWRHSARGMVPPADFIPLAEETGLINQIGEWVLRQACKEAVTWPSHIAVAVNLSPVQFKNQGLPLLVASALSDASLPAHRLELEITEAVLLQNNEATLTILRQIQQLGVRVAMDDFGTGYSSLSYLRSFPFDKIKIDRSFIKDIADKEDSSAIVQAVTELADRLHMTTTAEGVETVEQLEKIQVLGCTEMQGYLFSRPLPAQDLIRLFASRDNRTLPNMRKAS